METGKTLTSETLLGCAGMCTKVHIKRGRWKWKNRASTKDKQQQGKKRGEGKKWKWVWGKKTPKLTKML
jgi:hypothetical protein